MQTIGERGLKKHLEEHVFVGKSGTEINHQLCSGEGPGMIGVLRSLDDRFYIQICTRNSLAKGVEWKEQNERYDIEDWDVIRIENRGDDGWQNYWIQLK